uniref:Glucose dehydrogenase [FAD, quinone] n=3 Tax=Araneus ventricosus TaxID=182803 RepID=A0A4Y2WKF0_ARAVE|nr:Glucose dehydrogenase [FAD, quinone] [Araneus ventricosus]GBO36869.1 Glucose dehydrogenase [FAD, quinone] [Araneus ventricosus]GBO36870.1 Glucose dehydrogenase [FAD, quinone] [Araneus ventricosus]
MDKVRLLPSGVQGLVPTEAVLSSFTMNRSPIVLDLCRELEKRNLFEGPTLVYSAVFTPYENGTMFACLSQMLQPKSRGTVRLQSTNPYDPPAIDPNYFEDPEDLKVVVEGMKTCQRIATSGPMRKVGARPFETVFPGCEEFVGDEDSYFTCIARGGVVTMSHQVGTAKMGDPRDPTTVVDPLLR